MPTLQLLFHGELIKELSITTTETTVGRSPDNDIVIDNQAISGHHCRIGVDGDIYFVEDLNSTNGISVNDEKTPRSDLVQIKIKSAGWFRRAPENAAMIARRQDGYTKLNGTTIRQRERLKDGDLIVTGGTTLRFEEQRSD